MSFKTLSKVTIDQAEYRHREPGLFRNNAGGWSTKSTDWEQLMRFLILGTTGGTFYLDESKVTEMNLEAVERCIENDPAEVIRTVVEISDQGRAASNDPALFVMAMCIGRTEERLIPARDGKPAHTHREASLAATLALAQWEKVARRFTDYSHLIGFVKKFRKIGGSGMMRALSRYYTDRPVRKLEDQAVKYWNRDGYSQQDCYRLMHPTRWMANVDPARRLLFDYFAKGTVPAREALLANGLNKLAAYGELQNPGMTPTEAARIVRENQLPMEAVPKTLINAEVYEAVLQECGMTWMVRNLANLGEKGLLTAARPDIVRLVCEQLTDEDQLKRQRMHPLQILKAALTYKLGRLDRGETMGSKVKTWEVVPRVVDALDQSFRLAFRYAQPSGKRLLLATDISGSMWNSQLTALPGLDLHSAAAIMALVVANVEKDYTLLGFHYTARPAQLHASMSIDAIVKAMRWERGGGTDLTAPLRWARENRVAYDGIVSFTDYETWANKQSPKQELDAYAQALGVMPKVVNVAMTPNGWTAFGGSNVPNTLEVVGFDANVPEIVSKFMAG